MIQYSSPLAFLESLGALRTPRELVVPLAVLMNGHRDTIEISLKSVGVHRLLGYRRPRAFGAADPVGAYARAPLPRELRFIGRFRAPPSRRS